MRKIIISMCTVVGMLVIGMATTGFTLEELGEFFTVFTNRSNAALRAAIPLDVEIDRMEVILKKLDNQVESQKYAVAKSKIALEDAKAELHMAERRCQQLVSDMRQLRSLNPTQMAGSCGAHQVSYLAVSQSDINRALSTKLASWKQANATSQARSKAVEQQQLAYGQLEQKFSEWQSNRELLRQRLETLRARHKNQQLSAKTDTNTFNQADLARASELADQIDKELRIVEAQQALGNNSSDILTNTGSQNPTNIAAEVDAVLNQQPSL